VTDATIQVIVRCAETDVSTQRPDLMILILDPSTRRKLLQVRMAGVILKRACKTVTDAKIQMIVRCAETDASTQCLDLMILIVDPSTWRMDGIIMKCACETVTDEKIQMIVRCAETDASQCLDVIVDPSTTSMDGVITKCASETVTDEKIQMIVRCAKTDAPSQCLDLMILIVDPST